jgi:hypothetical protein
MSQHPLCGLIPYLAKWRVSIPRKPVTGMSFSYYMSEAAYRKYRQVLKVCGILSVEILSYLPRTRSLQVRAQELRDLLTPQRVLVTSDILEFLKELENMSEALGVIPRETLLQFIGSMADYKQYPGHDKVWYMVHRPNWRSCDLSRCPLRRGLGSFGCWLQMEGYNGCVLRCLEDPGTEISVKEGFVA